MASRNKDTASGRRNTTVDALNTSYTPGNVKDWPLGDPGGVAQALDAIRVAMRAFHQGTFIESFDALVTSDGATITMTIEHSGGGDLTMVFSDGHTILDCTPADTIPLTPGDDDDPILNCVFITKTAKILEVGDEWPDAEHIKVGKFVTPSASLVNTGAAGNNFLYGTQNINDHASSTDGDDVGQGHLAHTAEKLRHLGATWHSGCEGVATQDGDDLWVSIASGSVSQLHHHTFAALDSDTVGAGDPILVVNDPDAAYTIVNSLNEITKHSDGSNIGINKYVKFVLTAIISKTGEVSPMLLSLPSDEYNSVEGAERDVNGFADFTVPNLFNLQTTMSFLIAAFVCKHTSSGMILQSTIDQRGKTPATAVGGGTGGGDVTAATAITDNAIVRGDGGAKGVQGSGVIIDDSDSITGILTLTAALVIATGLQTSLIAERVAGTGVTIDSVLLKDGEVDGRNVATDGSNQDSHIASTANPHSVDISDVTPLTTKGDVLIRDASASVRLAVGSDGQVLTAQVDGTVAWEAAAGGGGAWTDITNKLVASTKTVVAPGLVNLTLPILELPAVLTPNGATMKYLSILTSESETYPITFRELIPGVGTNTIATITTSASIFVSIDSGWTTSQIAADSYITAQIPDTPDIEWVTVTTIVEINDS